MGLGTAHKCPRWGCTSVKHSGIIPSFDQLVVLCLIHFKLKFAFQGTAGSSWASCQPAPPVLFLWGCSSATPHQIWTFVQCYSMSDEESSTCSCTSLCHWWFANAPVYPDPSARAIVPQDIQHSVDWLPDIYSPCHFNSLRALPSSQFFTQCNVSLFILQNIWTILSRRMLWWTVLKELPKIHKNYIHCCLFTLITSLSFTEGY